VAFATFGQGCDASRAEASPSVDPVEVQVDTGTDEVHQMDRVEVRGVSTDLTGVPEGHLPCKLVALDLLEDSPVRSGLRNLRTRLRRQPRYVVGPSPGMTGLP
jgi:hypothetical protein